VVHRHLNDALVAVGNGVPLSAEATLSRWRQTRRDWAELPVAHPGRPARSLAVAHAWLDYQVASKAVTGDMCILVTDAERRFVTASANAGVTFGRPCVVGLQIDDVTAEYARPFVPELWNLFDVNGSMSGEYDCDRPGLAPMRIPFRGTWGRPLPELQVGYLDRAAATTPVA